MSPTKVADHLLSWASDIEPGTIEQAARTARLPFVDGHVALMPDAHVGMGATVGSVIPTKGAIVPSAVGVDIGCGMIAAELPITSTALPDGLGALHGRIAEVVPAGLGQGHDAAVADFELLASLTPKQATTATRQLGSLGSGNHFVEVCLDETDVAWLVLHSGSRGHRQAARRHPHHRRQGADGGVLHRAGGPRSGLPGRGHSGVRGVHRGHALGSGLRHGQPGGDDGQRARRHPLRPRSL